MTALSDTLRTAPFLAFLGVLTLWFAASLANCARPARYRKEVNDRALRNRPSGRTRTHHPRR